MDEEKKKLVPVEGYPARAEEYRNPNQPENDQQERDDGSAAQPADKASLSPWFPARTG